MNATIVARMDFELMIPALAGHLIQSGESGCGSSLTLAAAGLNGI